ncbi:NAD-dependent epimerase/dehydratase family protein [Mesorhizobium sp. J428]|uniref:NAD-dependent epimerase/dehydratase family protein n=1 Tax=Mesorhizobium sp. J428 TaxID=2898440 RepID=UPI002151E038|nr:NAD-dependent epimerase/dehydratase family protein [Mesorhizobium sp. J428]MCR5858815.1 NAD-dependent epimerase/dehydratase family protein [Mesorhizobium sp. J428]
MDKRRDAVHVGITGASGFLGGHVARHLSNVGFAVRPLSRNPARATDARLLPPPAAPEADFRTAVRGLDAIVHCAALNNDRPADAQALVASNVELTGSLAEAAAREGAARFVYVSSIRAVADPGIDIAIDDETVPAPSQPYGRSKRDGELAALAAAAPGLTPLVLRLPPVYGTGMRGNLGLLMRLARTPAPLPLAGLRGRRSLISSNAAARAVETLLTAAMPARSTYLATDAAPVSIPEILAAFRRGLGTPPRLFAVPEALLATSASLAGRGADWAALTASQTCNPASLVAEGWTPDPDSLASLERLAAALRAQEHRG